MKLSIRAAIDALHPFSRFFIERPRFAGVVSIVLSLAGAVALMKLPVAQYPEVQPPRIVVACNYFGANAHEVMNTVASPLEDEMNGVENMLFMASSCADDGNYSLGITEQLIFSEIDYDKIDRTRGMDITFVTTADNDEAALALFTELGFPFKAK